MMTKITLAQPIYDQLMHHGSISTTVHSVFNAACNLQSPFGLISLLTQPKKMNPSAILLPQGVSLKSLIVGAKVELCVINNTDSNLSPASAACAHIDNLILHINLGAGATIVSEQIARFNPSLPAALPIALSQQSSLQLHIASFLQCNQKSLGIYPLLCQQPRLNIATHLVYQPEMMIKYITPHLQRFIAAIAQQDRAIELKSIIGFGAGLTPSMDDLLVGFGAGLTPSMDDLLVGLLSWLDFSQHPYFYLLAQAVQASAAQTTDVSQAMLLHATHHRYNQEITELYAILNQPLNPLALDVALDSVVAYGHSSGHDTLCGIYLGLIFFGDAPIS